MSNAAGHGTVYLVGAGPGEPELITVRGQRLLAQAGAVVYDALVHPALLAACPAQAERVYVGKTAGRHSLPQEEINRLLVELAARYAVVVRLKGGDPFVFGRGGEEAQHLAQAGVRFEIVPGVSAGIAGPAFAGIPVTHRGKSGAVCFITAHTGPSSEGEVPLDRLALEATLVFFMGVGALPRIAQELRALGRPGDTPAAVIEWATYARQRTVTGTLDTIAAHAAGADIAPPAIVVVGPVAALREELAWFETRPLFGLRVALTHAAHARDPLESRLRALGAEVLVSPTLEFAPVAPEPAYDPAAYDWIVLMSANAVQHLYAQLDAQGRDLRALAGVKVCAAGAANVAEALEQRHLVPDAVPERFGNDAVLAALEAAGGVQGQRVLVPRADVARSTLPQALRDAGAEVDEYVAYRKQAPSGAEEHAAALAAFAPELVVFTNADAVRNFLPLRDARAVPPAYAVLGPVTATAAQQAGLPVAVQPAMPDAAALVEAICAWRGRS